MMISDFLNKVENTIIKYNMTNKSERLLVGLSGGADSVALLLCLKKLGYSISACHINHCLRGEESDRDENFCVELCQKLGVELSVSRINVLEYCQANSLSTEEGARILRYAEFEKLEADKICTAHNLNDCLETAVFNLARGSGLKGVASIPPVRDNIVRPLIECSRNEIEEFLAEAEQKYVTDSTNLADDYSRNKIRHSVIPTLERINPSLYKTFTNTVSYLREDSEYLENISDNAFDDSLVVEGYSCCKVKQLDYPVRRRVIMRILSANGISVSSEKIKEIEFLASQQGKINIKRDLFAVSDGIVLRFVREDSETSSDNDLSYTVIPENEYSFYDKMIKLSLIEYDGKFENVHKKFANYCLDYDKIKGEIVLRNRCAGDKIKLVNRNFTSDVRILFKDAFSVDKRKTAFVLADRDGVVFAEGFGAAERVKIDVNTKRILVIKVF